ncbi:MAG: hypothetical protein WD509_03210 [Candidatus Paceibacterota bacterium]
MKEAVLEILNKGYLMSLATFDDSVWVSDLIYIYDEDLNIYWMSDPAVRHSKALVKNNLVAGTITISNHGKEPNLGIQFSGKALKIEGPRHDLAVKHLKKRGHPEPKEEDDVLDGDSWYMLVPDKIDIIDEEKYGYDKRSLDLSNE